MCVTYGDVTIDCSFHHYVIDITMRYHDYAMKEMQPSYARIAHPPFCSVSSESYPLSYVPSKETRYGRENKATPQ